MPTFTVPATGTYRSAGNKDVRYFKQGDVIDVEDAIRFGMAGAARTPTTATVPKVDQAQTWTRPQTFQQGRSPNTAPISLRAGREAAIAECASKLGGYDAAIGELAALLEDAEGTARDQPDTPATED